MSARQIIPRTQSEVKVLQEAGQLLTAAIAQLDLRGTDEQVSKALTIVHEVVSAMTRGKQIRPDEAHSLALRRLASKLGE